MANSLEDIINDVNPESSVESVSSEVDSIIIKKVKPLEYIKKEDLPPNVFPTKYFAFVFNYSKIGNPYSQSRLRQSLNIGRCKFLTSATKENILRSVEYCETDIYHNISNYYKYLIIVRLEDISSIYNTIGFNSSKYSYIDDLYNVDFNNSALHIVNAIQGTPFHKEIIGKKITGTKKCFRTTYLSIMVHNDSYLNMTISDPVSKCIYNLVSKSSISSLITEEIKSVQSAHQNDIAFIFHNILSKKLNTKWYHQPETDLKFNSCEYKYQYIINGKEEFIETGTANYRICTNLVFTDYLITDFRTADFYPLRLKIKMLMNMCEEEFIKELFKTPFVNSNIKNINNSTRLCATILQCGHIEFTEYMISLVPGPNIKITFSESFLDKFIKGETYMNGWVIKSIFPSTDMTFINFARFRDIFANISIEIETKKTKFKSTIHNELDKKIIGFDKLFSYQRTNIAWMERIEKDIRNGKLFLTTNYKFTVYPIRQKLYQFEVNGIKYVNMKYPHFYQSYKDNNDIYDANVGFQKYDEFKTESAGRFLIKGGIIADDIGLGKTASTICHIINQLENDKANSALFDANNLIILPPRLIKQWEMEFEKFVKIPIKIIIINTLRDIKNHDNDDVKKFDIVLLCRSLLNNSSYTELLSTEYTSDIIDIYSLKWNRIILDEAHEALSCSMHHDNNYHFALTDTTDIYNNIKKSDDYTDILRRLKSNYKWCLTATPYCHGINSLTGILQFLLEPDGWDVPITNVDEINYSGAIKALVSKTILTEREKQILSPSVLADMKILSKYYEKSTNKYLPYLAIDPTIIIQCMSLLTRQTLKSDVRNEIKIPEFVEKKIYIDFTTVERKIYNIIADIEDIIYDTENSINLDNFSDSPSTQLTTRPIKQIPQKGIKHLFQLCTNLLIKDYFTSDYSCKIMNLSDSKDDVEKSENISLNMLQSYMISKFKKLIVDAEQTVAKLKFKWDNGGSHAFKLKQIYNVLSKYFKIDLSRYIHFSAGILSSEDLKFIFRDIIYNIGFIDNFENVKTFIIDIITDKIDTINNDINILRVILEDESILKFIEANKYQAATISQEQYDLKYKYFHFNDYNKIIPNKYIYLKTSYDRMIAICSSSSDALLLLTMGCIIKYIKPHIVENYQEQIDILVNNITRYKQQLALFNNDFISEQLQEPCMICYDTLDKIIVTQCRHIFCEGCYRVFLERSGASKKFPCPACRSPIAIDTITRSRVINPNKSIEDDNNLTHYRKKVIINGIHMKPTWKMDCINKYGSKMSVLLEYLGSILEVAENRIIIFSQYDNMLKLIGRVLNMYDIQHVYCKGSVFQVTKAITNFKKDDKIRIIMLSSDTANSGNNLTEANHVIFIDVFDHPKETTINIEKQAIGRTVRLGQNKGVIVTRFIMRNTVEELQYNANQYDMASLN